MASAQGCTSPETSRRSFWRRTLITGCISWSMLFYVVATQPPEKRAALWMRLSDAFHNATIIGNLAQDAQDGNLAMQGHLEHVAKYAALFVLFKLIARTFQKRVERRAGANEKKDA